MYYSNDNLSILQAVTKSTQTISSPTTHDPTSLPSPIAPLCSPSNSETDDEYSYAFISTEEIDLAAIKKQKARRLKQLMKDESSHNSKDVDDIQEKDSITTVVKSSGVWGYSCIFLVAVVLICFIVGMLSLLEANKTTTMIHQTRTALNTGQEQLWDWQENSDKAQWDRLKTWLQQEKAVLFSLVERSPKWIQNSLKWKMDPQAVVKHLDQYLFFGKAAWIMDDKTND